MHALRHVHELLVPGGTLVDIHPVTEDRVEAAGKPVCVIPDPDWLTRDLPNSEAALEQTIAEGLFELEAETNYDVLEHFDDADELIDSRAELLEPHPALVDAIRAASRPLVARVRIVLRRLRAQ